MPSGKPSRDDKKQMISVKPRVKLIQEFLFSGSPPELVFFSRAIQT